MARSKILIIDNEPALLDVLSDNLQEKGFEVHVADDGDMGLELVERERPDLVLLDYRMPRLDGIAVLREIREIDPNTAVIMMSADASPQRADAVLGEGADDFVTKPFDLDYLVASIAAHLSARASRLEPTE